jgi:hypothetical protein
MKGPVRKRHAELVICYRTPTRWQGRRHHACVRRRAGSVMRSQRGYRTTGPGGREPEGVLERWEARGWVIDDKATSLPEPPSHLTYIVILEQ